MSQIKSVDTLFPLLLKKWKQSWVEATNSAGELKCKVELAWGDGYEDGEALIKAMDAANVDCVLATDLLAWSYRRQKRFALDLTEDITALSKKYPGRVYGLADYDPNDIRAAQEGRGGRHQARLQGRLPAHLRLRHPARSPEDVPALCDV